MATLRHPNIVQFLGICSEPPAIITGTSRRGRTWGREGGCPDLPPAASRNRGAHICVYRPALWLPRFDSPVSQLPCTPSRFPEYASHGSLLDVLRGVGRSGGLTWVRRLSMALDAAKVRGNACPHGWRGPIQGTLLARCVGRAAALASHKACKLSHGPLCAAGRCGGQAGRNCPC